MELTLSRFFFDIPIYEDIQINDENWGIFSKIVDCHNREEFNGYNPFRKLESTFVVITDLLRFGDAFIKNGGVETIEIKCKRYDDVFFYFILWEPQDKTLIKIGQYPTVADFHIFEVKQYSKLLGNEKMKEFTRAIGLAANGVGIGSFVYLRRIFEHLIFEAYSKVIYDKSVIEDDFQKARMDEKIVLLHNYLPSFLIENKSLYSILSLGIHELDEKTCLAHFDTLRVGIEIILDEKLDELRKQEKIQLAKQKLSDLKSKIKK